jgi:hypothetical protein
VVSGLPGPAPGPVARPGLSAVLEEFVIRSGSNEAAPLAGLARLAAHGRREQVGADAEQFRNTLQAAGGVQDSAPIVLLIEALDEVPEQERRTLHPDQVD